MNKEEFMHIIDKPSSLKKFNSEELSNLKEVFPYCQTVQILKFKQKIDKGEDIEENELDEISVYAGDREHYFNFLAQSFENEEEKREVESVIGGSDSEESQNNEENQESEINIEKPLIDNPNEIEIRTDELEEILGHPPKWIVRRGILVISIVILALLIGSYFFKYPDVTNPASITITTEHPPVKIVARTMGKIQHLFVKNNDSVSKGQILAVIENPANYEEVIKLKKNLIQAQESSFSISSLKTSDFKSGLSLGNLQASYTTFVRYLKDYEYFIHTNQKGQKLSSLNQEMSKYKSLHNQQQNQLEILRSEYELAKKQFSRDSTLFVTGAISNVELEQSQTALLQKKYSYGSMKSNMASTKIQISSLNRNALDTRLSFDDQGKSLEIALQESFDNLLAQIKIWEEQFLLQSTVDGQVAFTQFWSVNQHVNVGDEVMTVVPSGDNKLFAKLQLPVQGSGKVKEGQLVNIKLSNYPYMEYGMVNGVVKSIALVPSGEFFMVEVDLPNGLKTNYKKDIKFVRQLQGTAEIITDKKRLIERFIEPIKAIIKKNQE